MNDRQRLAKLKKATNHLENTAQGHIQWVKGGRKGSEWKAAMKALNELAADLRPDPVPQLGPVWRDFRAISVLKHDLTHATSGIPLFPAFDDAFEQGYIIIAPEAMTVIPNPRTGAPYSSSNPGKAFYTQGVSKLRYWFGHLDRNHAPGTKFKKGDAVGKVAPNSIGGGPHVHVGINIELFAGKGKELKHHTDYTHGAPLIGVQLKALMEAA